MADTVLLLHGIWMRPFSLHVLKKRLQAAGFNVIAPAYSSVRLSPADNAARLFQLLQKQNISTLHIVAHSLGGIVGLHLLQRYHNQLPMGRLVTLGSPVNGSIIANTLLNWPFMPLAFGKSMRQGLSGIDVPTHIEREWGAVIGTLSMGLGVPFMVGRGQNDGTVQVCEAEHPAQTDRLYLPVSHTGMVFSEKTAHAIFHFLQHGQFKTNTA